MKHSSMKLHISNTDLCTFAVSNITATVENLLENLDDISKYKVSLELAERLEDYTQMCYDNADEDAQILIDILDKSHWNYEELASYTEYNKFVEKFLSTPDKFESEQLAQLNTDLEERDVKEEFGFGDKLSGQFHFPRDYDDELSLMAGIPKTYKPQTISKVDTAEQKRRQRAEFLAQVKAQQNTPQSE